MWYVWDIFLINFGLVYFKVSFGNFLIEEGSVVVLGGIGCVGVMLSLVFIYKGVIRLIMGVGEICMKGYNRV